jgi:hypothetical protein
VRRETRWTLANEDPRPEHVRPAAAPHCPQRTGGQNVTSAAFNIHVSSNQPLVSNCKSPSERWPLRVHPHLVLLGLVLLVVLFPLGLSGQKADCPNGPALLSPSEPAYSDAMELRQTLESHGFEVRCVFPTHLWSIFEVASDGGVMHSTVEGEANFRTNYGDLDAVFMPPASDLC